MLMSATLVPARKTGKQPGFRYLFSLTAFVDTKIRIDFEISKVVWDKVLAVQVIRLDFVCLSVHQL